MGVIENLFNSRDAALIKRIPIPMYEKQIAMYCSIVTLHALFGVWQVYNSWFAGDHMRQRFRYFLRCLKEVLRINVCRLECWVGIMA